MKAEELKVVRITEGERHITIMLNTAECVYFHKFGNDIYIELSEDSELRKSTFLEFKKDIQKHDWSVEKLIKNWVKNGKYETKD